MNTQATEPYKRAWKAYELSGHDVTRLSAADLAALRSDDVTRRTIDARPAEVTARTKAAAIDPERLADEVATAIHAELSGESDALTLLFHEHYKSQYITSIITTSILGVLFGEVRRLRARAKELEATPSKSIEYQGTYDATKRYAIGDVVTDHGSAWIAKVPTAARPGFGTSGSRDWQLFVKKGSDGRDGKDAAS